MRSAPAPRRSTRPLPPKRPGTTRMAMPASPSTRPAITGRPGRSRFWRPSRSAIQIGTEVTIRAARPGGHPPLRPRHEPVAAQEQHRADRGRGPPVTPVGLRCSPRAQEEIEEEARDQVTRAGHEEAGKRLDGEADREVGRAPEDIDSGEGERHARPRGTSRGRLFSHEELPEPGRRRASPRPAGRPPAPLRRNG